MMAPWRSQSADGKARLCSASPDEFSIDCSSARRIAGFDASAPSPKATTGSLHSRRIDPMSLSATPFCQGERGAMGLSRMPIARSRRVTAAPQHARSGAATPSPRLRGCARTRTLDRRHASSSAFTRSFDRSFRHYCPQGDRRECRWASATTTTSDISERSTQVSKLMSFMKSCSATPISRSWPNPILMQALCKCIGPRAQALCSEARASFQSGASQVEVTQRTPFPQRSLYAAAPCPIIGVSRARQKRPRRRLSTG